jgi:hypothetical protein
MEGKRGQELPVAWPQDRPGPGRGLLRRRVHSLVGGRGKGGVVVVSTHHQRSASRVLLHQVEHRHRIGAVAHQIPEKGMGIRSL